MLTFSPWLTAFGPARCAMNNGGCWSDTKNGKTFSACSVQCHHPISFATLSFLSILLTFFVDTIQDSEVTGCQCPHGFQGDGHKCEGTVHFPWLAYATSFRYSGSQTKASLIFLLFRVQQMLMNARNVSLVNVTVALVRTHGVDMTASVGATFCT